jgi:signal peptidase I
MAEDTVDEAGPDREPDREQDKPDRKRGALREGAILVSIALVLYYVSIT